MELINILKIKIQYLLKYDKILYIKIDLIYSIVHVTIPSRYEKIIEDRYLRPFRSVQLENQRFPNSNDKKKLSSSLRKLTKLNEIRFKNKISLKKYMINK